MPRKKSRKRSSTPDMAALGERLPSGASRPATQRFLRPALVWPVAVAVVSLAAVVAWYSLVPGDPGAGGEPGPAAPAVFVGSERCVACHAQQSAAWGGSQHALAMQPATEQTVLGAFDGAEFTYAGTTSRFYRRDGKFIVRTDGPDGQLADFEVQYTFGLAPLQQYLVELPRGRLQALSIAWDARPGEAGGQRWFHLYPGEQVDHRDELHWTRLAQNWNFMCADCHSTGLRKGYDAPKDSYETTWEEVSVGCEACHGPGSAHVEWAERQGDDPRKGLTVVLDERRGVTWAPDPATNKPRRSVARASEREIEVCAPCHARRSQVAEGYEAGRPFLDHYLPSLLSPGLYHADGQQQDEVFIWGSWLQSRMHQAGVTCSDCHDPHTQKLRAPGNAVCAQCHAPSSYDAPSHHRHEAGSAGAQCAACHMPRTTYMVVDPRRDHSMRVPRPDESLTLGVPNACNSCHTDRDAKWAAKAVRDWLGRDAAGFQSFARMFQDADEGHPAALERLAATGFDMAQPAIVRASALERLALLGGFDPSLAKRAARDAEPLVKLAAARLGDSIPPDARLDALAPLLGDARRAVRIEAARALAGAQSALPPDLQPAWRRAADEYVATLRYNADRPEASVALGGFYGATGRMDEARAAFDQALRLDPTFVPAYVNAADLLRVSGRDPEALEMLERGLREVPQGAALYHSRGLVRVRQGDLKAGVADLRKAAELAPDNRRYAYVLAIGLNSSGNPDAAVTTLEAALEQWPGDRALRVALTAVLRDAGRREEARQSARRLLELYPDDPEARALAAELAGS